jgi:hypothetical protein
MAAASSNPWNLTPAEEPSAATLGADANGVFVLVDEKTDAYGNDISPPDDGTMLNKRMVERAFETALAASRMVPSLRVTVRFSAGDPIVDSFRSTRDGRTIESIEVVDNGTGDTTVRVVDTTLPPKRGEPGAVVHAGTKPTMKVEDYSTTGYRGARVTTWDNGSAADLLVTVEIW